MVRLLPVLLALAACGGQKSVDSPTLAPAAARPHDDDAPVGARVDPTAGAREAPLSAGPVDDGARPASTDAIEGLLRARHTDDLPTRETLDRHDDAAAALRWLAQHATMAGTQDRALTLLGLYPAPEHAAFLALFSEPGRSAAQRAAALRGLAAMQAPLRAPHRAVILAGEADPHRAVAAAGKAAAEGLAGLE